VIKRKGEALPQKTLFEMYRRGNENQSVKTQKEIVPLTFLGC